jgi:NodT family efflux transporter outer membrane factor (OMF) lipoprotein
MKTKISLLLTSLTLLVGCAVGPDYEKPAANTPTQWSEPLAGGEKNGDDVVTAWWKTFHDPELDSLINRAAQANLDVKIAEARVREARAQLGTADSDFGPTVDATGSYTRERLDPNGVLPVPPSLTKPLNVYQAGFDASWEIDVFGGERRNAEAADAELSAAEFGRRDALVTLLGEVARNYVEARGYQRRLEIARENIQAEQDAVTLASDSFQKGLTSELDVRQASTLLATTQADVPTLESSLKISIHRLSVLLAQPPGALLAELSATAPIPSTPSEVPVGLPADLLQRRPDVQQAERELAAATANIGVATADLFPKFYLTGATGEQSISASNWFSPGSTFWSVGPTVQWRIFDANRIRSNIQLQNARQEEALARYEKTVLGSFEDVEDALVAYANEQVRRQSLDQAAASSEDALHLANQRYANGLASFLDVVDAERTLYATQDQLAQSDRTIAVNLITLYKALGGGWDVAPSSTQSPAQKG